LSTILLCIETDSYTEKLRVTQRKQAGNNSLNIHIKEDLPILNRVEINTPVSKNIYGFHLQ